MYGIVNYKGQWYVCEYMPNPDFFILISQGYNNLDDARFAACFVRFA